MWPKQLQCGRKARPETNVKSPGLRTQPLEGEATPHRQTCFQIDWHGMQKGEGQTFASFLSSPSLLIPPLFSSSPSLPFCFRHSGLNLSRCSHCCDFNITLYPVMRRTFQKIVLLCQGMKGCHRHFYIPTVPTFFDVFFPVFSCVV